MVLDGLRGYLKLANGLTEVTRERALATAKSLVSQGEAAVPAPVRAQVTTLTEELLATSKANRNLLVSLVRSEVERSVSRLGLVSTQELAAAARREKGLERRVAELEDELRSSATARKAANTRAKKATAKKTAKKATAKKTAKKATAKKTAKKATTKKSTTKKSTTKKAAAKKSTARRSTAAGAGQGTTA
jgi:polyhydroxyalkanoate synthesis regulator phasin